MATPKWTVNRLTRCTNNIQEVMTMIQDDNSEAYAKLKKVDQSLTGLIVMIKKENK